jgi:hypothetical protein
MSTFYLKLTDARFALGRVSFFTAKSTHFFNGSSSIRACLRTRFGPWLFDLVICVFGLGYYHVSLAGLLLRFNTPKPYITAHSSTFNCVMMFLYRFLLFLCSLAAKIHFSYRSLGSMLHFSYRSLDSMLHFSEGMGLCPSIYKNNNDIYKNNNEIACTSSEKYVSL